MGLAWDAGGMILTDPEHHTPERYVAFLRAINVGGRTLRMETLRELFSELGFANVETFIASGNVIFEARSTFVASIEKKIEDRLARAFGYPIATFVRTPTELAVISACQPFAADRMQSARAFNIGFYKQPLSPAATAAVMALTTPLDEFHIDGRELYWLCRERQSDSSFSNNRFERAINGVSTLRGASTVAKLAAKYSS